MDATTVVRRCIQLTQSSSFHVSACRCNEEDVSAKTLHHPKPKEKPVGFWSGAALFHGQF